MAKLDELIYEADYNCGSCLNKKMCKHCTRTGKKGLFFDERKGLNAEAAYRRGCQQGIIYAYHAVRDRCDTLEQARDVLRQMENETGRMRYTRRKYQWYMDVLLHRIIKRCKISIDADR